MNTQTHHTIDAIGIDIGYFQTKFTRGRGPDRAVLLDKFPSCAVRLEQPSLPDVGGCRPDGVVVKVGGLFYFVGPDAYDVANKPRSRHIDPAYTATAEYAALLKGALHRIAAAAAGTSEVVVVKHLGMGLPVFSLEKNRGVVVSVARGEHAVPSVNGEGETRVIVENVHVVAQPQGAILAEDIRLLMPDSTGLTQTSLVVDIGGGTFDWLVTTGLQLRPTRSGSCSLGTFACLEAAAAALNPSFKEDPHAISALDRAMRMKEVDVQIGPRRYSTAPCWEAARQVMIEGIKKMVHKVNIWADVAHVLVTGGGAPMFLEALRAELPDYANAIRVVKEPVTANVKGFHLYAENMAARERSPKP